MNVLMHTTIIALAVLVAIFFAAAIYLYRRVFCPRILDENTIIESALLRKEYPPEVLDLCRQTFTIDGTSKHHLNGFLLDKKAPVTVIFVHGITSSSKGMLKYISFFSQHHCNIIAYDHRGHGLSYEARPTYGWFEKKDLRRVVDFAWQRFPGAEKLVLFGESMGAATVLQYAPSDSRIYAIIVDSPFSSFKRLLLAQLAQSGIPSIGAFSLYTIMRLFCMIFRGFDPDRIKPVADIARINTPLLIFHSSRDSVIPPKMATELATASIRGSCRLINAGDHTLGIVENRSLYEQELITFWNSLAQR